MGYFRTSGGGLGWSREGGGQYINLSPTHGRNEEIHRREMISIAETAAAKILNDELPEIESRIYAGAANELLNAFQFDIESIVKIGIENCGSIFYDSKTQKAIANAIITEMKAHLQSAGIRTR